MLTNLSIGKTTVGYKIQQSKDIYGEYDTGSERTLAACLNDASLRERPLRGASKVADG